MIDEETSRQIKLTRSTLISASGNLNNYLDQLIDLHVSQTEHDREVTRKVRDKIIDAVQFIDELNYKGVVDLDG